MKIIFTVYDADRHYELPKTRVRIDGAGNLFVRDDDDPYLWYPNPPWATIRTVVVK